jgi:hypothetical protein
MPFPHDIRTRSAGPDGLQQHSPPKHWQQSKNGECPLSSILRPPSPILIPAGARVKEIEHPTEKC